MSWRFEVPAECDLFQIVLSYALKGTKHGNTVSGDPIPGTSLVQVNTASATLEGTLRIDWGDGLQLEQVGFQAGIEEFPHMGLYPGPTINTAVTDVRGFCATPKRGAKLDRAWHQLAAGDTVQHEGAGYVVVVEGEALVNAHTLTPYRIGKGETFDITAVEDSIVVIIWER